MLKLKSIGILMLAVLVCIGVTNAAVQKNIQANTQVLTATNLDISQSADTNHSVKSKVEKVNASLQSQGSSNRSAMTLDGRNSISVETKQSLQKQLLRSGSDYAAVTNPDGTITAAFKQKNSRATHTYNSESLVDWSVSDDGFEDTWGAELGYDDWTGSAAIYAPVFYYDLSLLPATATVTGLNVDFHFVDAPWTPLVTALFTINDLFTEYDGSTNYQAVLDDALNTATGNSYGGESTGFTTPGTYNYVLNAQAQTDLEARLVAAETWFGLALEPDPSMSPSGSWAMGTLYGLDPSILYITYSAPGEVPVITGVTATPNTVDNIGMGTTTLEVTWTDADDHDLDAFGMIFEYVTPWDEVVPLSGGVWEKTGTGSYRWYGEWDPDQDHQIGIHDIDLLFTDGSFPVVNSYPGVFTITTPATEYADFNTDGPLDQWPAGYVVNPATNETSGESWQYQFLWSETTDYIGSVMTDYDSWSIAQDCTFTTPGVDFTSDATAHFFFDVLYTGAPTNFTLEGSIDDFATVADSIELTTALAPATVMNPELFSSLNWNITSWAAGQSNVKIRFHFVAPATGDPAASNSAAIDVLQFVGGDAPVVVTDTTVTPATGDVMIDDSLAFSVDFTASTSSTVDDFVFSLYMQSDAGLQQELLTGLSNGDVYGSTIVDNGGGSFTATISDLTFQPGIEIGLYDLMGYVSNGIDWDYDDFTDNEDVLTLTTASFWYEDFNDGGATGPTGWSTASGGLGPDWSYVNYTGTTDYFAAVQRALGEILPQSETCQSEVIDCTGMENCFLYYAYGWQTDANSTSTGEIRVSNDNGSTWNTIYIHTGSSTAGFESGLRSFDISAYADGQAQVLVEFLYTSTFEPTNTFGEFWRVDIVQIHEEEILPLPSTGPIGLGILLVALGGLIVRRRK